MLCWARIWLCWACWAGLGEDLALLGALGWVGRGVWPCWDLALLGALGWVGRGIWSCKAGWAGLGVRFGSGGRRKKSQKTRLLWVLSDLIDLLAVFRVYAGIILMKWFLLQTQISFTLSPENYGVVEDTGWRTQSMNIFTIQFGFERTVHRITQKQTTMMPHQQNATICGRSRIDL